MNYQTTFKRYELKYLLTPAQKALILQVMQPHMALDRYGRTAIRNIYFDTENFRLIRRSLEKPAYKEKLRIRSYRAVGPCDDVFVELKKKYRSVVYKRRLVLPQNTAISCFRTEPLCPYTRRSPRKSTISAAIISRCSPLCFCLTNARPTPRWKTVIFGLHLTKTSYTALITFP